MNEIRMSFYSLSNLFDSNLWVNLFSELERIFDQQLSHLDDDDPIRKKVSDLETAAEFICLIGEQESSRKIFGKFGKSKIEISFSIYKETTRFTNSLNIYFPENVAGNQEGLSMLKSAFEECNRCLKPFYSICDSMDTVATKKKATRSAVNLQAELIGIFWLSYFSKAYVDYFGHPKFQTIPGRQIEGLDGRMVELGESPFAVNVARDHVEALLGKESFVDPSLGFDKPSGKNALMYDQLR